MIEFLVDAVNTN